MRILDREPGSPRCGWTCLMAEFCCVAVLAACGGTGEDPGSSVTAAPESPDPAAVSAPTADAPDSQSSAPVEGSIEEELRAATTVIEDYYAAINSGALDRAYLLWADSGRASGQTLDEFRSGYTETARVEMSAGEGTLEGAAGSRFAEIPVRIDAVTRDGTAQRFEGSYVLRRAVVDGATAEQRSWHIYSAEIREVR